MENPTIFETDIALVDLMDVSHMHYLHDVEGVYLPGTWVVFMKNGNQFYLRATFVSLFKKELLKLRPAIKLNWDNKE